MADDNTDPARPSIGVSAFHDATLELSGRLTINEAEMTRDQLLRGLADCQRLTLETARLEAVDLAGLQLLISARRSAEQVGKAVRLAAAPKGALLRALIDAGLLPVEGNGKQDVNHDAFWSGRS